MFAVQDRPTMETLLEGMLARRERETDVRESAVIGEAGSWH